MHTVLWALFSWACIATAQPSEPSKPQNTPKDVSGILESKGLPEARMYFETVMDGRPIGYQVSSLTPAKGKEGAAGEVDVAYEYRAESILTRDNGMRIDNVTIARLKRNFEPITITIDRQLAHPESRNRHIEDRVQVGESEITLAHEDNMASAPTPPRSLPKPKEPFVYGMEFVIEAIDLTKSDKLKIPELNPKEGTVSTYRIVAGQKAGDQQEMVLQEKEGGGIGYRFRAGPNGRIESWADSSSTIMMQRVTEERYKQVRRAIEGK